MIKQYRNFDQSSTIILNIQKTSKNDHQKRDKTDNEDTREPLFPLGKRGIEGKRDPEHAKKRAFHIYDIARDEWQEELPANRRGYPGATVPINGLT